jgi:hypothetical protein
MIGGVPLGLAIAEDIFDGGLTETGSNKPVAQLPKPPPAVAQARGGATRKKA